MKFTGPVAEEFKLRGNESIGDLLQTFRISQSHRLDDLAIDDREGFPANVKQERNQGVVAFHKITSSMELPYDSEQIRKVTQAVVSGIICTGLDAKYDSVSPKLFELVREIEYPITQRHQYGGIPETPLIVQIPLFVSSHYGSGKPWQFSRPVRHVNSWEYDVNIESTSPPLPAEVREKARNARADFLQEYADALRLPAVGDCLSADQERFLSNGGLDLNVYWIPKPSELKITVQQRVDPDPLLIGTLNGRHYLIAQWNVEAEEPFEHYVAELNTPRK